MHKERPPLLRRFRPSLSRSRITLFALIMLSPWAEAIDVAYRYDTLGRLTNVEIADGSSVVYTLDRAGNRISSVTTRAVTGPDSDGDGIPDALDLCPLTAEPSDADNDGDALGDACDSDDDNDGVMDGEDAFPFDVAEWLDSDGDGIGDNADSDDDNDAVADAFPDNCPFIYNPNQRDSDFDGIGNACDDSDDFCWACLPGWNGWRAILR